MTPEMLFDEVLDDLAGRLTMPTTQYKLLRAAGLIRLLLTDGEPLADKVVQMATAVFEVHVPARRVAVVESHDPLSGLSSGMYLGSRIRPRGGETVLLSREEFLGVQVASSSWTGQITVKDVVRSANIAFGGVHLMAPSQVRDQRVTAALRMLNAGDIGDLVEHVADIGHITLGALRGAARLDNGPTSTDA